MQALFVAKCLWAEERAAEGYCLPWGVFFYWPVDEFGVNSGYLAAFGIMFE